MKKKKGTKFRKTVTIGHDMYGKAIRKDFYGATKKELNAKIDAYKVQAATGGFVPETSAMPFDKWAWMWVDAYKDGQVEQGRLNSINSAVRKLCAHFGGVPINRIREADVMRFYRMNNNYKSGTLHDIHVILKQIFEKAVANGLLEKNPIKNLKTPVGQKPKQRKSYTYGEYRTAVDFSKTHPKGLGPFIMLKTGVRLSELLGLKGSDVDFEKRIVYVRRTVTDADGLKPYGKTKNAMRAIPIDDEAVEYLKLQMVCHTDDLIFPKTRPYKYRMSVFYKFQDDLLSAYPELPKMTPHEYRHTFGTLLYQSGTELLTLSRIMGHASVTMTQRVYVHDTVDDIIKNVRFPSNHLEKKEKTRETAGTP